MTSTERARGENYGKGWLQHEVNLVCYLYTIYGTEHPPQILESLRRVLGRSLGGIGWVFSQIKNGAVIGSSDKASNKIEPMICEAMSMLAQTRNPRPLFGDGYTIDEQDNFRKGRISFSEGIPYDKNPFAENMPPNSEEFNAWGDGWLQAQAEDARRFELEKMANCAEELMSLARTALAQMDDSSE